jgi:RND family efflux transporter MFP subunit
VTIAAQVAGQVEKFPADLGDRANAGQELALIDTTSYEALAQQAAANLAKATAAATNAARNLKRTEDLQKDKIASASEYDKALADADSTTAEVKAAEAAAAVARLNLERSRVKAPFDGAVAQRLSTVGGYVAIGTPILKFVKTEPLRLRLDVPERESSGIKVGQTVRIVVEGDKNVYTGKLSRVAPALRDSDRMLAVEADVPPQGSLRPGLFARAYIVVNEREQVISIPTNALTVFAGLEKVVTVKDGKAAEKVVTTGRLNSNSVEIVSGLSVGETVVLDPAGIRTGQPLILENTGRDSAASANQSTNGQ